MTRNNTPWEEDSIKVNDADGNLAFEVIDLVKPDKLVPTFVKGAEYSDWRKELEESWSNITTGNKVGQTFLHVPSGTTVSTGGAIGGVETVPTTLTVYGDTVAAPDVTKYAIQGYAQSFIKRINGSFSNVVGLCLYETRMLLEGSGYFRERLTNG